MKSRGKLTDMDLEDRVDMDNKFDDVKMIESLVESYKDQGLPIGDLVQAQLDQVNSHWFFKIFSKKSVCLLLRRHNSVSCWAPIEGAKPIFISLCSR